MQAVVCTRYGPPEVLCLTEVDQPEPGPGEVRVRVRATTVTTSDCFVRGFRLKPSLWIPARLVLGVTRPRRPVLGMVFAGDVDAVGPGVAATQVGQAVYGFDRFRFGCYAEYKVLPASGVVAPKPANLDYERAAALPYGGLLALSFLRGRVRPGQNVLVYGGSGAVGTAAVQLAKHDGARVTAVCGPANADLVASLGADTVIDYHRQDVTEVDERFDLIFVAVGDRVGPPTRRHCRRILTPDGTYLAVDQGRPVVRGDDLRLLTRLAEAGRLTPVIDRRYGLAEMAEAHRYVEGGHKRGNVVVTVAS
ncbi:NAD(P)-dependent alcohol dehydrogenase [Dactylosporangium salmoneum]|uniref:NAD(P)-dependent alcohol dehydrogenase n=1 Tax=Dactylosporangium salmoneum TaxID=53361 RepID=A0ABP5TRE8_9ACTN